MKDHKYTVTTQEITSKNETMLIIIIGQPFKYGTSKSTYKFNKRGYDVEYFISMLEREMTSIKAWPRIELPAINVTVKEFNRLKQPEDK